MNPQHPQRFALAGPLILALVLAAGLVAPAAGAATPGRAYLLGSGDVLRVTIFLQPDISTEVRVSEEGTIMVPLLGVVDVAGGTARQAESRITELLRSRGQIRDPQVSVFIAQFKSRQVSVVGHVNRPGRYALEEGAYRLSDVLAMAGGLAGEAGDRVTLIRGGDDVPRRHDIEVPALFRSDDRSSNVEVRDGDTVYVDRAPRFYIYGEVQRPGVYRLDQDMTVMQGLSVGGGLTLRGTEKDMRITRRAASGEVDTLTPTLVDRLQPDDVIFVRESMF